MLNIRPIALMVLGAFLVGCGGRDGPELVPASGTIFWKSKPLPDADVTFYPIEGTKGAGGSGRTDADGRFSLKYVRGGTGVPEGKYKVIVSRRLIDGKPVPAGDTAGAADSPAREELPEAFSSYDNSKLTAAVSPGGEPIVLHLK